MPITPQHSPTPQRPPTPTGWQAPPASPSGGFPAPPFAPPGLPSASGPRLGRGAQIGVGLVLLVPATVALLWSYLIPSITTLVKSFQRLRLFVEPAGSVGGENYQRLFRSGFGGDLGIALLFGLVPLLLALLVAPLLAVAAERSGRIGRLVTRGLLALPLAAYAPVAITVAWSRDWVKADVTARGQHPVTTSVWTVALLTAGLVIAIGASLFLNALRRRTAGGRPGLALALAAIGGVLGLGVVAAMMQAYAVQRTTLREEPGLPVARITKFGFVYGDAGVAAAGGTVLLVLLAVFGLAAVVLLVATRTRIEFDGWRDRPASTGPAPAPGPVVPAQTGAPLTGPVPVSTGPGVGGAASDRTERANPVALVLLAVGLLAFLGIVGYVLWPWMRSLGADGRPLPASLSAGGIWVNTWLPPLLTTVVAVGVAALGGFAIGAMRPLGRASELLLLPFAPWLFVGNGPLVVAEFFRAKDFHQFNSFAGLIPPGWVSIPTLLVFTLLFRGQRARWDAGGRFGPTMLLPALPMLVAAGLLSWLIAAQDLLWPEIIAQDLTHESATSLLLAASQRSFDKDVDRFIQQVLPMPMLLLFLLAFVALQLFYLDRLAIRAGREPSPPR